MHKILIAMLAAVVSTVVLAKDVPVKMSEKELLAFLPGTHTSYTVKSGSLHRWTNEPDGKFVASTNAKKYGSVLGVQNASASGTWKVNDEGKYCVKIDWQRETENWCAFVFKGKDGEYFLGDAEPSRQIEFEKGH